MKNMEFLKLSYFKKAMIMITACGLLIIIFALGMWIGISKSHYSYKWGDNYGCGMLRGGGRIPRLEYGGTGMMRGGAGFNAEPNNDFGPRSMMPIENFNANGSAGNILKIDANNITIKDRDDKEIIVTTNDKTVIAQHRQNIKLSDLQVGDDIVAIGQADDSGHIVAKFIRVVPGFRLKR